MRNIVLFLLWLIYLIYPNDLIPDRIPYIGRLDDFLLLAYLYWNFFRKGGKYNRSASGSNRRREQASGETGTNGQSRGAAFRQGSPRDPYAILGVNRSATMDEIKRAYREQANRYHPDKVSHLGEEFQAMAKNKFQDIQWAYEKLAGERGSS